LELCRHQLETAPLEPLHDLAHQSTLDAIRFD
jgi:hypothetical protein